MTRATRPRRNRVTVAVLMALGGMLLGGTAIAGSASASSLAAVTAPPAGSPATVTADALPTVQINGVVWAQVTVGNTVYVTGSFTSARPAGAPAGTYETARSNLLAYDLTTGNLVTTFNHTLNAQGRSLAVSPDQKKLYVGGDFTKVDGVNHYRIAEFGLTAAGALVGGFAPTPNNTVKALAATNTAVYAGGTFTAVGSSARTRLAEFSSTGALLPWAPTADNNGVAALVLTPAGDKVIVGGSFTTVNGVASPGLGAVNPATGATTAWGLVGKIRDSGTQAGITSLSTDGTSILGTGYVYGGDSPTAGKLEGAFSANPSTGALNFLEDCHGDTYGAFAVGSAFYVVSHEHYCGNIGAFGETSPRTYHRATAFTNFATGTVAHNASGSYTDWYAQPAPTQLNWYPTLATGTYTGQTQAAWSIAGNSQYVSLGGEFPSVNGKAQQGLVRFALAARAPNKVGPTYSATLTPTATSTVPGTVQLTWGQTADPDNTALTYKLVRNGTVVDTETVNGTFYTERTVSFTDTGLVPGSTPTYRLYVYDPIGNFTSSLGTSVTVAAPPNVAPVASFTSTPTNLSVAFDGSASSDPDGTVASYSWNYGDGSVAGTGVKPTYAYAAAGTYTVTLTVTDNQGATNSTSAQVTVSAPANQAPVASFTSTPTNLSVAFDGSASSDPDGTVASYSWNYGDGSAAGTGVKPTYAFAAAGTYTVTLTVTDNQGATNSTSAQLTVSAQAN